MIEAEFSRYIKYRDKLLCASCQKQYCEDALYCLRFITSPFASLRFHEKNALPICGRCAREWDTDLGREGPWWTYLQQKYGPPTLFYLLTLDTTPDIRERSKHFLFQLFSQKADEAIRALSSRAF